MTGGDSGRQPAPARSRNAPDWMVLSLASVAQFMVVLDISIVNVALPSIRHNLHFSASGLQWVVNAYTLAFAGFLLLGGRAADLYGRRRVFILGLALFSVASLVGGMSQSPTMLTVARAAQGLGGAILSPATLTIITTTFTEGRARAKALGVWSSVAGAGGAAGALLGGVLTNYLSWRWILFVNVPIGAAAMLAAVLLLTEGRRLTQHRSLDVGGAVLVTAGLVTLVYGIVETNSHSWGSAHTLVTLAVAVVLLVAFVLVEARVAKAPVMPLRLFRSRSVSGANITMLLVAAAFFAMWYFLSLYLQNVLGYSPIKAGLAFFPMAVGIIVGAQIGSRFVPRTGPRPLLVVGMITAAAGLWWFSHLGATSTYWADVFGPGFLAPLGVGLAFTPLAAAATTGVEPGEQGLASGLLNTSRQVGGAIGLAALATAATAQTAAALRAGPHGLGAEHLALTSGFTRAFAVSAIICLVAAAAAGIVPSLRPPASAAERDANAARPEAPSQVLETAQEA